MYFACEKETDDEETNANMGAHPETPAFEDHFWEGIFVVDVFMCRGISCRISMSVVRFLRYK